MKIIPYEVNNGSKNMEIDEQILNDAIKNQSKEFVLRFYGWNPKCISLGRNQKNNFLDRNILDKHNIDIVKRLTGGRALLHDKELTYSCVCPANSLKNGNNVIESYKEIAQMFIDKFKLLDIDLEICEKNHSNHDIKYCMLLSTSADLCYKNKKFIGSAQFRKENYILQHGSILIDYDKILLEELFNEEINSNSITCLKEINPDITINDIVNLWSPNDDI